MIKNPLTAIDFYKSDHISQYPKNTTEIYSNLTARSFPENKYLEDYDSKIVFFGLQFFLKDFLIKNFNENFFNKPKNEVIKIYKRRMDTSLGKDSVSTQHIGALHDLGYIPLKIKGYDEGTRVPIGVPLLTIKNTHPDFFWLTNYIETILLAYLWKPLTSATTAFEFKKLMHKYSDITGSDKIGINFQVHDFSFRGMSSLDDAHFSGASHLTCFWGTDTIPAIDALEEYYNINSDEEIIGASVPATEHSVMSAGGIKEEALTYKKLLTEVYPKGILSIVSDTWDLWNVVDNIIRNLKQVILNREGKLVIRPDSGDPVKIICGDPYADKNSPAFKGVLNILWEIFGGEVNHNGYKILDPHIGIIYGDSISLSSAREILEALKNSGYASSNIVFGVGSSTYQNVTRDMLGFAIKATSAVIDNKRIDLFKNPITDDGMKKSSKGLLKVENINGELKLFDSQNESDEEKGVLKTIFIDGKIINENSLKSIRERLNIIPSFIFK